MKKQPCNLVFINLTVLLACVMCLSSCQSGSLKSRVDYKDYDGQASRLVSQMSLDEKVGQMIQTEAGRLKSVNDVEDYYLGSILSGGGDDPKAGNSPKAWADLYEKMQSHSMKTRLGIPLLYGVDAVHGHSNVVGATIFPHNIGLGCSGNAELVERIAEITAREMRGTGIHWTFAPCVTVPQDERWGRYYEGFFGESKISFPIRCGGSSWFSKERTQ